MVGERRAHLRERALRQAPLVRARQRSHHLVVRARVRRHARRRAVVAHLQKQAARLDVRRRPRALARAERGVVERQRQRAGARRLRRFAVQGVAGIAQPAQRVQRAVRVAAVRRALQRARRAGEALALAPLGAHALEEVVVAAPAAVLARGPHVVPGGEAPGRLGEEGGVFGSRAERAARAALVLARARGGAARALRVAAGFTPLLLARGPARAVPARARLRRADVLERVVVVAAGVRERLVRARVHLPARALDELGGGVAGGEGGGPRAHGRARARARAPDRGAAPTDDATRARASARDDAATAARAAAWLVTALALDIFSHLRRPATRPMA